MKKLNSKYVESVVKKQQMAKSSRFTEKKLWKTVQIERRQETRGTKRKIGRPTWKPGPNQPWKSMVISNKKYHGNK